MKFKERTVLLYLVIALLCGAISFLYGFFPLSYTSDQRAESRDLPEFIDDVPLNKSVYEAHASRTILMVVDALRTDFIQSLHNGSMKYTNKIISEGTACLFNIEVESPTVTMPRIKAMTTGTIPNFIDVVLNLGSSRLNVDSLLHQTLDNGEKIVFAGDNTWMKMFPNSFERTFENRDSLYVNDFYEGDKNITKHLSAELKRGDWKLLILHYLGLDHIGHVEGPFSGKIAAKLKEMDVVVMHIHLAMQEWQKRLAKPPLLIVTGDHGMRDAGGHGGSSHAETNTPLLAIGMKCGTISGSYKQIDIAPTLSVLLGLPIPASNIGSLITDLLDGLTMEQQLFALYYNGRRLLAKFNDIDGQENFLVEIRAQFQQAEQAHKRFLQNNAINNTTDNRIEYRRAKLLYNYAAQEMRDHLAKLYVHYDDLSITIGLIIIISAYACLVLTMASPKLHVNIIFWLPLTLAISGAIGRRIICSQSRFKTGICSDGGGYYQSVIIATLCFFIGVNINLIAQLLPNLFSKKTFQAIKLNSIVPSLILFGVVFHAISYASSSFVEEEHNTWYYLNSTIFVILYFMETRTLRRRRKSSGSLTVTVNVGADTTNDPLTIERHHLRWILLFAQHLIARRLNQTGDKWLSEPDIGDWLTMDENRMWNSFFVVGSLCLLYLNCVDFGGILTNVLTLTACILIYYFRTLTGSVYFAGIKESESTRTCTILFWLNIVEIAAINFLAVFYRHFTSKLRRFDVKLSLAIVIVIFVLVASLTHKPHNIFVVATLLYTCTVVDNACVHLTKHFDRPSIGLLVRCAIHIWIGKQAFFYQGNSNNLASIDLNAGFVGLQSFHFGSVAILLTINTYSGPILSMLMLAYHLYDCVDDVVVESRAKAPKKSSGNSIPNSLPFIAILFGLPFAVYTIWMLVLRDHIFVWTVFSPKLLYEFYTLCIMIVLWVFMYFIPDLD